MLDAEPKKNHIMPKSFQALFANEKGKINVYDKKRKKLLSLQDPANVAVESGYYPLELEKELAEIESKAMPVIKKLIKGHITSEKEKDAVFDFICTFAYRTKSADQMRRKSYDRQFKHGMNNDPIMQEKAQKTLEEKGVSPSDIEKILQNLGNYHEPFYAQESGDRKVNKKINDNWVMSEFEYMKNQKNDCRVRDIKIIKVDGMEFILNDNPITIIPNERDFECEGLRCADHYIFFPLSPIHGLVIGSHNFSQDLRCTSAEVEKINKAMIANADCVVMSSDKDHLQILIDRYGELCNHWSDRRYQDRCIDGRRYIVNNQEYCVSLIQKMQKQHRIDNVAIKNIADQVLCTHGVGAVDGAKAIVEKAYDSTLPFMQDIKKALVQETQLLVNGLNARNLEKVLTSKPIIPTS